MDQDISFDLQLSSNVLRDNTNDPFERLKQEIRLLESENDELTSQLQYIQKNPHQIIQKFQAKLLEKITQLREENDGIQQLIEKSKIPGYAEMTKKKSSFLAETPGKSRQSRYKDEDEDSDFDRRNPFDPLQMSEKFEVSTCQNYPIQPSSTNPFRPLQPLQNHELQARAQLTCQLLQVINRTSEITSQFQKINEEEHTQHLRSLSSIQQSSSKLEQIAKYKQKLLHLLKKLKTRETNQEQIVREYQNMYEETLKKFKQATQLLNQLSKVNDRGQLDDLYAEVLQLQERLKYINDQLDKIDETQWLKDIQAELLQALKRLGINPPEVKSAPNSTPIQILRDRIDSLAEILIQCGAMYKADQKQRLTLLKLYYEEEKENNKKIIKNMQNKEQGLSKKLIDMQMNN